MEDDQLVSMTDYFDLLQNLMIGHAMLGDEANASLYGEKTYNASVARGNSKKYLLFDSLGALKADSR